MANSVVIRQGTDKSDDYWKCFPPFLWLLRDVLVHMPERDGKVLSPTEYLTMEVLGGDDSDCVKAAVRKSLTQCFPSFECRTLPPPSTDPTVMENVSASLKMLDSLFNLGVDELVAFAIANIKIKKIFDVSGTECDGPTFATFVEELTEAVNDPQSIPALDSTWKIVVKLRCKAVQERLMLEYSNTMKERYNEISKGNPLEEATLLEIHHTLWSKVIRKKLHDEVGPLLILEVTEECTLEIVTNQLEEQLVQRESYQEQDKARKVIGGLLLPIVKENSERSQKFCNDLFIELYTRIREQVQTATSQNEYTPEELATNVKSLFEEYDARSIGPEKWNVRAQMEATIEQNEELFQIHIHEVSQHAKKVREQKEMVENLRNELRELKESRERMDERFGEIAKQLQEAEERRQQVIETDIRELKQKVKEQEQKEKEMNEKEMKRRVADAQRITEESYKREIAEEKLKAMEDTLKKNKEEETMRRARADVDIQNMQRSIEENKVEEAKRKEKAEEEIDVLKSQIKEWQQKLEQKKNDHDEQKAEADTKIKKMEESLLHQKQKEAEEGVKQEKKLRENTEEFHEQQLLIEKMKADHEIMVYKIKAEREEEKRLKELVKEESNTSIDRLNQVIEDEKAEKDVQKKKWEEHFFETEKEKAVLSGRIENLNDTVGSLTEEKDGLTGEFKKLNDNIDAFERKNFVVRLFTNPKVRK